MKKLNQTLNVAMTYKKFVVLLLFIFAFTEKWYAQNISDTIYREEDIYQLIDQIEDDEMLQLEWLSSLHFHKMLNDYRNSKNLKSVHWDHKLWMAARNHNIYLLRDIKHLSHIQIRNKPFFSGSRPEDRVEFVTYNSNEFKLDGFENCYGISSLDRMPNVKIELKEMNDLAKSRAKDAFEAWRKSSAHNENMLNAEHITHGTSIIFGGFGIHATSIFARKQKYYKPNTIFLPFLASFVDENDFLITPNYQTFSLPENEIKKVNYKYYYLTTQFFKDKKITSDKKLYKITQSELIPENQKKLNKIYRKASGIKGVFELLSYEPKYFNFTFEVSLEDYVQLKGVNEIRNLLQNQIGKLAAEIKYWGGDIISTKTEKGVQVEIKVMMLVKKR